LNTRSRNLLIIFCVLVAGGLICYYFVTRPVSQEAVAAKVEDNLRAQLTSLEAEADKLIAQYKQHGNISLSDSEEYSFYLVSDSRVIKWSTNEFVPTPSSVQDTFRVRLLKEGNSEYVAMKFPLDDLSLIGVITLSRKFTITNNYLRPVWNDRIFPYSNVQILDSSVATGIPICIDGTCLFRIAHEHRPLERSSLLQGITIVFFLLGVSGLFMLGYEWLKGRLIPDLVLVIMLALLYGVRLIMTSFNFPGSFIDSELFNPLVFASSSLNASLGDLLLNEVALFVVCFYVFNNLFHFKCVQFLQQGNGAMQTVMSVIAAFVMLLSMLFPFVVIQTIYNNSAIALNISESLRFDGLRIAAMIAVLLSGLCSFLFSHAFIRLLIGNDRKWRIVFSLAVGAVLFILFNEINQQLYLSSLISGILFFLVVYLLKLYGTLRKLSFSTFTYLFVSVLFLSVNGSMAVDHFSRKESIENQFRFARNFLVDRDYFGEYLLGELSSRISGDQFIQTRVATPFLSKSAIRQKIRQMYIPSYFNKYDVEISVFNGAGELVEGRPSVSLHTLIESYDREAFRTAYNGVYFVSSPDAEITQKYLVVVPIFRLKAISGHVVIEFSLKKVIPENVYPDLLVDNRFLQFYRSRDISYAVYVNNDLSYSSGTFNYEGMFNKSWFGYAELHTTGIAKNGHDHIAEEDENGRVAVVSLKSPSAMLRLANFSFFLVLGLATIMIFILIQGLIKVWEGEKFYFSTRIQLFLNLAFFLPLIIVSAMSLQVTSKSSQNQVTGEYLDKTKKFSERLSSVLHESLTTLFEGSTSFENSLVDLAILSNLEANVYSSSGILFASSQPLIFENRLISSYVNPEAFAKIRSGQNLFIEKERVGSLEYYTAFASLKAPSSGALIGIVSVPFFQSIYSLERAQIDIVANILNIFALIFVVLVALSYFITQWLTFPLTFITQSLRKTSLTKTNQPLVWKTDDEIGLMVKEYNQMLYSLSESKAELEQTQRERAWREIAQQVAHEIKNPLTPMKLTLQQLERTLSNGNTSPEKLQKALSSLLSQVDTLNDIASSFSSFAKMPEPVIQQLELMSLLRRTIDLHANSGDIRFENYLREANINGDEQLLGRTFSNIILNALQAGRPGIPIVLKIKTELKNNRITISFSDNGKGIEPEIAEQIFVPHFTTKKSGSGLGLAIARQAIEQMKGSLWFETLPGRGTTFFIELPLVDGAK
jgi:two-component system, NtrC family, nitrogen regulation sensor histidine kinase NtrY